MRDHRAFGWLSTIVNRGKEREEGGGVVVAVIIIVNGSNSIDSVLPANSHGRGVCVHLVSIRFESS